MKNFIAEQEELALYLNSLRLVRQIKAFDKNYNGEKVLELLDRYLTYPANASAGELSQSFQSYEYMRKSLAVDADIAASKDFDNLLQRLGEGEFRVQRCFDYLVINPLDTPQEACILLPTDFWECGKIASGNFSLTDENQKTYKFQIIETMRGNFVIAKVALKPNQKKRFTIQTIAMASPRCVFFNLKRSFAQIKKINTGKINLGNQYYRLSISNQGKGICNFISKQSNVVICGHGFFQPVLKVEVNDKTIEYPATFRGCKTCYLGAVSSKYVLKYEFHERQGEFKYFNVYLTAYHGLKRIELTIDFAKDNSFDKEQIFINMHLDGFEITSPQSAEGAGSFSEQSMIGENSTDCMVVTAYDTNFAVVSRNDIRFRLFDNFTEGFRAKNSCLMESRFVFEECKKSEVKQTVNAHDISVLSIRE